MGHAPETPANLLILISILPFPGQMPINTSFQQLRSTRNMVGASCNPTEAVRNRSILTEFEKFLETCLYQYRYLIFQTQRARCSS